MDTPEKTILILKAGLFPALPLSGHTVLDLTTLSEDEEWDHALDALLGADLILTE